MDVGINPTFGKSHLQVGNHPPIQVGKIPPQVGRKKIPPKVGKINPIFRQEKIPPRWDEGRNGFWSWAAAKVGRKKIQPLGRKMRKIQPLGRKKILPQVGQENPKVGKMRKIQPLGRKKSYLRQEKIPPRQEKCGLRQDLCIEGRISVDQVG